jgi:hypothetical protein
MPWGQGASPDRGLQLPPHAAGCAPCSHAVSPTAKLTARGATRPYHPAAHPGSPASSRGSMPWRLEPMGRRVERHGVHASAMEQRALPCADRTRGPRAAAPFWPRPPFLARLPHPLPPFCPATAPQTRCTARLRAAAPRGRLLPHPRPCARRASTCVGAGCIRPSVESSSPALRSLGEAPPGAPCPLGASQAPAPV